MRLSPPPLAEEMSRGEGYAAVSPAHNHHHAAFFPVKLEDPGVIENNGFEVFTRHGDE
jgi:hypothetical protein